MMMGWGRIAVRLLIVSSRGVGKRQLLMGPVGAGALGSAPLPPRMATMVVNNFCVEVAPSPPPPSGFWGYGIGLGLGLGFGFGLGLSSLR